uniref:Uncharacterized protein n=1 Tax=Timema shepardi TaxID=629360 RepID=A0A7R9G074_TIMSH|nr:unnamed protein product [Timema shepardi]
MTLKQTYRDDITCGRTTGHILHSQTRHTGLNSTDLPDVLNYVITALKLRGGAGGGQEEGVRRKIVVIVALLVSSCTAQCGGIWGGYPGIYGDSSAAAAAAAASGSSGLYGGYDGLYGGGLIGSYPGIYDSSAAAAASSADSSGTPLLQPRVLLHQEVIPLPPLLQLFLLLDHLEIMKDLVTLVLRQLQVLLLQVETHHQQLLLQLLLLLDHLAFMEEDMVLV